MIYLDEFLRQTQSQLRETAAEKISKQETIDDVESSSKKVGAKVDELIKKWQEKKAKFNDKINPKLHMTEELKIDMNQMTTKTDDEIDGLMWVYFLDLSINCHLIIIPQPWRQLQSDQENKVKARPN